jgi:hypothetical protein
MSSSGKKTCTASPLRSSARLGHTSISTWVDPGPRSRAETRGAWHGSEVVCGCVLWSAQRWEVSYGFMRGNRGSRSSELYIFKARHRGQEQHRRRASGDIELSEPGLHSRQFLIAQGYNMGPVIMYQDNLSCMAMLARGRSGAERTRHIAIRYYWTKERVDNGEMRIVHKGTKEMNANILTKPLQGSQFIYERECLTGWTADKTVKTVI